MHRDRQSMTERYAIIEGSGFEPADDAGQLVDTPYGMPSAAIRRVRRGDAADTFKSSNT